MEPVRFFVRKTVLQEVRLPTLRPGRSARRTKRFQTAGPAGVWPIARGLCGPGLLAHTITGLGMPTIRRCIRLAGQFWAAPLAHPVLLHPGRLDSRPRGAAVAPGAADESTALAIRGSSTATTPFGEAACAWSEKDQQGTPLGVHRGCGLSVCGVRFHGGLHGNGASRIPQRIQRGISRQTPCRSTGSAFMSSIWLVHVCFVCPTPAANSAPAAEGARTAPTGRWS